jgi:hypothetical protein
MVVSLAVWLCGALLAIEGDPNTQLSLRAHLEEVRLVWEAAPHNAFTDLTHWQGAFWCVFREGQAHVSPDGRVRILRSQHGVQWESQAVLSLAGWDLRDPKLSETPDGRLMLLCGATACSPEGSRGPTRSLVAFSRHGQGWTPLRFVTEPNWWLWRVTWYRGLGYGVAYDSRPGTSSTSTRGSRLLVTEKAPAPDEGTIQFRELVAPFLAESWPSEATIRFGQDGMALCLHRCDDGQDSAWLGTAPPPYRQWRWKDLGIYVGGPDLIQVPEGAWLACGRRKTPAGSRTVLWQVDVHTGRLMELVVLPSGGDTSYPGLCYRDGRLWISYYSSHEGKAKIYLAQVRLQALPAGDGEALAP